MDQAKLEAFMGRFISDMGGAAVMASVIVGEQLGLYRALANGEPTTVDELAQRTGCNARLLREWLSTQAATGYIEHAEGRFRMTPEQAQTLADEDSPVYLAGGASVLESLFHDRAKVAQALRGDGAIAWGEHHPCLFNSTERFFRVGYRAHLVASWLPALDGVVRKLRAGANVADVGCGHGASTVIMAKAFPESSFVGFDSHAPSIATATKRAAESQVDDRVRFVEATAKTYPGDAYDLICYFDCLHDMGDPVGAAKHAYRALKPDGTVLLVEPFANDSLEQNMTPLGRMMYAASTFICTPNSLSQEVGLGLGGQAGERRLGDVFREAGFTRFRRATATPTNLVLEARK